MGKIRFLIHSVIFNPAFVLSSFQLYFKCIIIPPSLHFRITFAPLNPIVFLIFNSHSLRVDRICLGQKACRSFRPHVSRKSHEAVWAIRSTSVHDNSHHCAIDQNMNLVYRNKYLYFFYLRNKGKLKLNTYCL